MSKMDKSASKGDKSSQAAANMPQKGRPKATASASRKGRAQAGEAVHTANGATPPEHMLTINIPLDEAIEVAAFPVKMAGRALSAKGGLPLFGGLGVLAAAQIIDWPVAAAAGIGYAVLRRWGPLRPAHLSAPGDANGKATG